MITQKLKTLLDTPLFSLCSDNELVLFNFMPTDTNMFSLKEMVQNTLSEAVYER